MKEIKIAKIADILLEISWLSILILLPLVFFPFFISGAWQISEYFVFQIITEMMFFIWLVKIILFGKSVCRSETNPPVGGVKSIKILLPAGIFIFVLGLSTIFSQSQYYSFWGIYYRKMGYLTWLHFFVFFLILFFNLKNKEQIKRIFWAVIFTVFVATIYGLMQIIGLDFLTWNNPTGFASRVFSTFGQPNFFASWLLLALPIVFLTFFQLSKTSFIKRQVLICLIILTLIVFIFTQSRAGWLGFLIALPLFILIFAWLKKKKKVFFSFLFFLFAGFLIILVLNLKPPTVNSDDNFLIARFKTLTNLSDAGGIRFFWWNKSFDLIKAKLVLGYGLETQKFNFARYYGPDAAAMEAINSIPDRAHNDFLDIFMTSGILGLLSYLFLLISVFYFGLKYVFKNFKNSPIQLTILALLTGLFGYLFSLQFSFHTIVTAVYFWVYLAIVLRLSAGIENNAETNMNPPPSPPVGGWRRRN
jgi:putative inorganic carbon (HCO3(-)) transporter